MPIAKDDREKPYDARERPVNIKINKKEKNFEKDIF